MNDVELQIAVATVTAELQTGFKHIGQRFDAQALELAEIKRQVQLTNGRVNTLEAVNKAREAGERATLEAEARAKRTADDPAVTWETAKTFAQFGGWIVAGLFGLLKLIGKL